MSPSDRIWNAGITELAFAGFISIPTLNRYLKSASSLQLSLPQSFLPRSAPSISTSAASVTTTSTVFLFSWMFGSVSYYFSRGKLLQRPSKKNETSSFSGRMLPLWIGSQSLPFLPPLRLHSPASPTDTPPLSFPTPPLTFALTIEIKLQSTQQPLSGNGKEEKGGRKRKLGTICQP